MNNENSILLNRLVEAIEEQNSPDWWTIGITVINAIIMVWLGWRQYQLQKQTTKYQEHETFKELYLLLLEMNDFFNDFIPNIHNILKNNGYISSLELFQDELKDLEKKWTNYRIEIETKAKMSSAEIRLYKVLMVTAYVIISEIRTSENVNIIPDNKKIGHSTDEELIKNILECFDENERTIIQGQIKHFCDFKDKIAQFQTLESLKCHCTI